MSYISFPAQKEAGPHCDRQWHLYTEIGIFFLCVDAVHCEFSVTFEQSDLAIGYLKVLIRNGRIRTEDFLVSKAVNLLQLPETCR